MKKLLVGFLMTLSFNAYAIDIAQCSNPTGKSYYPELGFITKKDSGWSDDKITGGLFKLSKIGKDKFDITFVDATKRITSSVEDGGTVLLLINKSGKSEYIQITSRGGSQVMIAKATLMRGDCEYINFSKLD
jgi:hypothetical protein